MINRNYDEAKYKAWRERQEREFEIAAQSIRAIYGDNLNELEIREIAEAFKELQACADCKGECAKKRNAYWLPVVQQDEFGRAYVSRALCNFGERRRLMSTYKQQKIPVQYVDKTFSDYEVTRDNDNAVAMAKWFIKEKPQVSLYYQGACGTGKTFLASLIAKEWLRNFKSVIFGDVPYLMEEIKRTFDGKDAGSQKLLDKYCDADLMVLDDMGAGQLTEWNVGILYQIINRRYVSGKSNVLTSNYDLVGLEKRLSAKDEVSAMRIVSRLYEMCKVATLGTHDRRKNKC